MRTYLQITEMDSSYSTLTVVFVIIYISCVSGLNIPQPGNLVINIWDGEVIAVWDSPKDEPLKPHYNVQMQKYGSSSGWVKVAHCTRISVTYCDLSNLIPDYSAAYMFRVQLVSGEDESTWTSTKRVYPNKSELRPPSFNLVATSSTLTVKVHKKPIYRKIFPFGMTYTIYLEDRGQDNKTTIASLKDEVREGEGTVTFASLQWGREYCVSLRVQGNGATSTSDVSSQDCLFLPEQEWYIISVISLSTLGVMAIIAVMFGILLCYLRRPEKLPEPLKSLKSGWLPLTVGEGPVEVVTDKGWFLIRAEVKNCITSQQVTSQAMVTEEEEEEARRTSMDSGVSVVSDSATKSRGSAQMMQEDSGCGSLGGSESSTSCSSSEGEHLLLEGMTNSTPARKREDSGVELGCQLDCSMILDGQDSEPASGDNYRSQSPSAVQIHVCDGEETFKHILRDTDSDSVLADVVTGYRAGHQSCICSGAGQCAWCHKTEHYGNEQITQYRATCMENRLLSSKNHFVDTCEVELPFSNYSRKTHIQLDTVVRMDDSETLSSLPFIQLGEVFPLLTALSSLPSVEEGENFGVNNMSLSLCDVELKTD